MTASCKSALAHKIAIERNLDIISLDSMAVYKGLDILTDKPVSYTHLTLPTIYSV